MSYRTIAFCLLCTALTAEAQRVTNELRPVRMKQWGIKPANFSGITPLGGGRYAVVSDKERADGFYEFQIDLDPADGRIRHIRSYGFLGTAAVRLSKSGVSLRDCEGIAFCPSSQTVLISGEGDQNITEYSRQGKATGRTLAVPATFSADSIQPNYGFEALAYDTLRNICWTVTENALRKDADSGPLPPTQPRLRLLRFNPDSTIQTYAYGMEPCRTRRRGRLFAHGVVALTALPDGRLLVLEREVNVPRNYIGARCDCRLFIVDPLHASPLSTPSAPIAGTQTPLLSKRELWKKTTRLNLTRRNFANYEGMCLAPPLPDGRWPLLLINDSQAGMGKGPVHLKDYLTVLLLDGIAP